MFDDSTMSMPAPAVARREPFPSPRLNLPQPIAFLARLVRRLKPRPFDPIPSAVYGASDHEVMKLAARGFRPTREDSPYLSSIAPFVRCY